MPSQWVNHAIRVGDRIRRISWSSNRWVTVERITYDGLQYICRDEYGERSDYYADPAELDNMMPEGYVWIIDKPVKVISGFSKFVKRIENSNKIEGKVIKQ